MPIELSQLHETLSDYRTSKYTINTLDSQNVVLLGLIEPASFKL